MIQLCLLKNLILNYLKTIKKLLVPFILSTLALFFGACATEYVATEPTYTVVERPVRPGVTHVWVNGDWMWNRRSNSYVYREGYWMVPRQGRTFIPGKWRRNQRGHYWSNGYWR